MTTIERLETRRQRVPLTRPWGPSHAQHRSLSERSEPKRSGAVDSVTVIATRVTRSDGVQGFGFSWTPQIGASAVQALLDDDIAPAAIGRSTQPGETWDDLWAHLHEAGGGGVTTIALAGLDLALWDAAARDAGSSLSRFIGRRRESARAYGSGVNLHYTQDELIAQVRRWVEAGFDAVKVKVGKPDIAEDLDRLAAVREVLGPDRALMIDANQRWTLERAVDAVNALAVHDLTWIEEPLRADDLAGHAELARRIDVPIAVGENLHTVHRFVEFLRAGAAQIVQPNVIRVGGITPFLRIAAAASELGAAVHPHLLPELSGQLALTLPGDPWAEDVEDAGFGDLGALVDTSPVVIADGRLTENEHPGLGIRFTAFERDDS